MRTPLYSFLRKCSITLLCGLLVSYVASPQISYASTLSLPSDTLSNLHVDATGVTHTIAFTTSTTDNLKQIDFQFSTTSGGSTLPTGMYLGFATLGQVNNLGSGWDLDTTYANSGLLSISRATAGSVSSGAHGVVVLDDITNSSLGECDTSGDTLSDTCWLKITTYSDDGSTEVDSVNVSYMMVEDPFLSFEVTGVSSGQTHNGITTTATSTPTSLPFGTIAPNSVKYAAHALHIQTNAPHGYKVYAYLATNITGSDDRNIISPFGATDATWATPQNWETPTGTDRSDNSGWFAANTTDSRISGWNGSTAKFGPISTAPHVVALSTGADRSGSTIYVTYGLGVNSVQPSDVYTGNILYDVQAAY